VEALSIDDDMEYMYYAGRNCSDCSEDLMLTDDVVLVQVVIPKVENGQVVFPVFENPDGSYAYEPYVFHDHCWGENVDLMRASLEEAGWLPKPDQYAFCRCAYCDSGIRVGEPMGFISYGQLTTSKRVPNGEVSVTFEEGKGQAERVCLSCLRVINDEVIEMWERLSYGGECAECTYERIWRDGVICDHEQE
jgi:hypothetical protein